MCRIRFRVSFDSGLNFTDMAFPGPEVINFFMLKSAEHEILNAHKDETIKKFSICQAQISIECYFSCS